MHLLPSLIDVLDVLLAQVLQSINRRNLGNVGRVRASSHSNDTLLDRPEQKNRGSVRADARGDALEHGLEWAAGRVTQERRERAVRLGHNAGLGLDGEHVALELRENVRVELEL